MLLFKTSNHTNICINVKSHGNYCVCRSMTRHQWLLLNANSAIFQLYHDENIFFSKSINLLAWNQDSVSKWNDMSIRRLLFQWASIIKIQLELKSHGNYCVCKSMTRYQWYQRELKSHGNYCVCRSMTRHQWYQRELKSHGNYCVCKSMTRYQWYHMDFNKGRHPAICRA
jgi:hypothetical protein